MARYYNHRRSPALSFSPGDMVYLDFEDIQTTCPSKKLSHCRLGPYPVERRVGKYTYRLVLPPPMRRLHPVFNVVKLSPAPNDPIVSRRQNPPPLPELVDGEEEYVVEKILNSRMFRWKLQYLVKWEGYGIEGNTWEYSENLNHAPEKVMEFHTKNLGAPRCICALAFSSIPFCPISLSSTSSQCSSRGGGDCKGNPSCFCFCSQLAPCTYCPRPAIAPDLPSASAALVCHVTRYLTHTDMYLMVSVLFIISVTLYISPYPQGILILSSSDPLLGMFMFRLVLHNNLNTFRFPASTAFRSASRPTAVALTLSPSD